MGQTIFYPDLNDFCRKYLVKGQPLTPADVGQFPKKLEEQNASLFEHFLLFDKISFKVYGENILVPYLIAQLGQDVFESLIEQGSIEFTLWTPVVTYLTQDIPGVMALQSGAQSSAAHSDPEESLELGFKWMERKLYRQERRQLIKKILRHCRVTEPNLAADAVRTTASAFQSGKLKTLGFSTEGKDLQKLALPERKELCRCATELLEYSFLVDHQMTSFSNRPYFDLFDESVSKISLHTRVASDFNRLAELEQFPDLRSLYREAAIPFSKVAQLRRKRDSVTFRKWLAEAGANGPDGHIVKEYIDAIADSKGFFETKGGKLTKSVVMTSIDAGFGALIGGAEGAIGGAAIAKGLEVGADFSLDMVDEFLLARLMKGWSPKMFFDELAKARGTSKE